MRDKIEKTEQALARLKAKADEEHKAKIKQRVKQNREEANKLRAELESANGTGTHSQRDLLWSMAWDHGHSSGLEQVRFWYDELAQLLEPALVPASMTVWESKLWRDCEIALGLTTAKTSTRLEAWERVKKGVAK